MKKKKNQKKKKIPEASLKNFLGREKPERKKRVVDNIKVVGVGGAGGNIITRMMNSEVIKGVEFIAVNTDLQDLNYTRAHRKLCIGRALTKGLGAGMNQELGKQAAEENRSEIGEILEGAEIVFVVAGFGGGTGTGASPIIAEIAREKGALTIGMVTKPFSFEGTQRMNIALEGISRMKDKVDALVVIPNDRVFSIIDKDTSLIKAFSYIDEVIKNAIKAIAEIINIPGIINVDFADIKSIMKDSGVALVGIGVAGGPERGIKAVQAAINSPLLDFSIEGARGVLFSIAGGRDLKMHEVNEIAKVISSNLDPNAKIIFGAYHDNRIKDKQIKVTVIATGFNALLDRRETPNLFLSSKIPSEKQVSEKKPEEEKKEKVKEDLAFFEKLKKEEEEEKIWEVPAFLREKEK